MYGWNNLRKISNFWIYIVNYIVKSILKFESDKVSIFIYVCLFLFNKFN